MGECQICRQTDRATELGSALCHYCHPVAWLLEVERVLSSDRPRVVAEARARHRARS